MDSRYESIFAPLRVRHVDLRNRVVVPPMVQLRPITSPEGIAWYRRLASGGPGLVIVEATGVPGFGAELTSETLKPLVDAIHQGEAAAAVQLFPIAFGQKADPNELTVERIDEIVEQYAVAARICLEAGFDGVEPHGAHGYLINQFFMPDKNQRTDDYGRSLENRCRLGVRIVESIKGAIGDDLLVLYRHTPVGESYTLDESLVLARKLVDAGVDILDISPAKDQEVGDLAAPFKAELPVPVIAVNGMQEPEAAAEALEAGRCDLVAVGRQMIADARWPAMLRDGRLADLLSCEKCNDGCFGNLNDGKLIECAHWSEDEVASYVK